jgi:hypothetical protein
MSYADDAWLAGFTDGEGSFQIHRNVSRRTVPIYAPRFAISLRADDLEILEALRTEFGGTIGVRQNRACNVAGARPQAQWKVLDKRGLGGLVGYFDRFPLQAKKRRDYAIWRRAVVVYRAQGGLAPELPVLCDAITAIREYQSGDLVAPEAEVAHLRLAS